MFYQQNIEQKESSK